MAQRADGVGGGGARQRPRALIAEDNPALARIISDILERDGWDTETAPNGAEALDRLESGSRFDVIVSDLRMPLVDGWEFFQEVRARHPGLARRFVFVTADAAEPAAVERLREAGAPVLEKPVAPALLQETARRLSERAAR